MKAKKELEIQKILEDYYKIQLDRIVLEAAKLEYDFQLNIAFNLAKSLKKNPLEIAQEIKELFDNKNIFKEVFISGSGFININIHDEELLNNLNEFSSNVNFKEAKDELVIMDYGGANAAKILHVGHLRSANIGEALNRLYKALGYQTISDVHLGDIGTQSGLVVALMKELYPDLICFNENYNGEDFDLPITLDDLKTLYPRASIKGKEDLTFKEAADKITHLIQNDHLGYKALWLMIRDLSVQEIKYLYDLLNVKFDLWEGELDSYEYIPDALEYYNNKNLLFESENALVIDITRPDDKKEYPPVVLVKSNDSFLYQTTDLGTIWGRLKRFNPDKMVYVVDERQSLHFEQLFRVVEKGELKPDMELIHAGFGTINGIDNKPFKTRDGQVMDLKTLIDLVYDECLIKVDKEIENKDTIALKVAIGALKFADLLPFRKTNYIFNIEKFTDFEGKTGPYIMYTAIRIKSLLKRVEEIKDTDIIIPSDIERTMLLEIYKLKEILDRSIINNSLNEICEYLYNLSSLYNSFYGKYHILTETDEVLKKSRIVLSKAVYNVLVYLLDILAIEIPDEM